ncbi:MAG: cadherin-like domain-containing protein [Candidatus Thiodiazotropha sp.]
MTRLLVSSATRFLSLLPALALCAAFSADAAPKGDNGKPPSTLRITNASYNGVLNVKGDRAERNAQITVSNANPALSQTWSTSSNRRGQWELAVSGPQPVPCRVTASDGVNQDSADVIGAPADCDGTVVVNIPPTAVDDSAQTDAGMPVVIDLLANDSDADGSLDPGTLDVVGNPANGVLADNGDGTVVYAPDSGFSGSDAFSYRVADNLGAWSNTASVAVTVNPVSPPPPTGDPVSINSTSANTLFPASPVAERPIAASSNYKVLAANDLGMHCADLDYQVFSILPPFNVVHAQVVKRGVGNSRPQLMDDANIDLFYSAASNANDPALSKDPVAPVIKSNFWGDPDSDGRSFGFDTYAPLFFGLLLPTDIDTQDVGLPVPDSHLLRDCLIGYLDGSADAATTRQACQMVQQSMPGLFTPFSDNQPQKFNRFDTDINFFSELLGGVGLGGHITEVNWFAADGIPILPVDDQGRSNAYPLVRVEAVERSSQDQLASTDIVLPVASEADCQTCHAGALDCASVAASPAYECDGTALVRTADWKIMSIDGDVDGELPPGDTDLQRLLNTAKINILRLHDKKHGTELDASRPIQCATCHYTPALDLAQLGPMDAGDVSQTGHITMSRAMHGHHGELPADPGQPFDPVTNNLFPDMPAPDDPLRQARAVDHYVDAMDEFQTVTEYVLEKTCYSCHPGKRTQCLRGAMAAGGVVCQDCHGQARHVGNDFSENLASTPWPAGANLNKRVPWASEPGCQSCHTGDAVSPNHPAGAIVADDGIRLLQAYNLTAGTDASGSPDGSELALAHEVPASRFAENENLYRLSKGHGGLMCQACHGSTHAIFPNPLGAANDNVAANQLQGHAGTIIECDTCHDAQTFEDSGALELTTNGPHGMHAVGSFRWNKSHKEARSGGGTNCQACHGTSGDGTVLSRMATDRMLWCKDEKGLMCDSEGWTLFPAGHEVGCADCHTKKL